MEPLNKDGIGQNKDFLKPGRIIMGHRISATSEAVLRKGCCDAQIPLLKAGTSMTEFRIVVPESPPISTLRRKRLK